jgi:hypothetical protein
MRGDSPLVLTAALAAAAAQQMERNNANTRALMLDTRMLWRWPSALIVCMTGA